MIELAKIKNEPLADIMFYLTRHCPEITNLNIDMESRGGVESPVLITLSFSFNNQDYSVSGEMILLVKTRFLKLLGELGIE